ncbi:cell division protein FtsN [Neisseria lactamica]|uniref:cell division protein FtsN n=1 Tax=Neisseria lactamica TaxID=486 RepID=UPI00031D0174|nr:cell division protein FtsN [Neisseria lactamica]
MSENKQNEVLTGYEQLKRRNRRRLVTASCLVAASCILLAAALSSDPADSNPAPQAGETGATENQTANAAQAPALKSAAGNGETAAGKPQDAAGGGKPADDGGISEPEDIGAPLVIINNRLDDSNIKGLEASAKPQPQETAATAQAEAKQGTAEKAQATVNNKDTVEKPKPAAEPKPQKTERATESKPKTKEPAQKTADKVSEKPKTLPEKSKSDSTKSDKAVKEPKKSDKAESKKPAEKDGSDGKKHETAQKTDKADKTKTAEKEKSGKKAAIQAGYAEKERALSLQRKMKAAGIDSTITEIMTDNGKVYRVKSSNYKNARDAERDLNKLRVHGIAGQVTNE